MLLNNFWLALKHFCSPFTELVFTKLWHILLAPSCSSSCFPNSQLLNLVSSADGRLFNISIAISLFCNDISHVSAFLPFWKNQGNIVSSTLHELIYVMLWYALKPYFRVIIWTYKKSCPKLYDLFSKCSTSTVISPFKYWKPSFRSILASLLIYTSRRILTR